MLPELFKEDVFFLAKGYNYISPTSECKSLRKTINKTVPQLKLKEDFQLFS